MLSQVPRIPTATYPCGCWKATPETTDCEMSESVGICTEKACEQSSLNFTKSRITFCISVINKYNNKYEVYVENSSAQRRNTLSLGQPPCLLLKFRAIYNHAVLPTGLCSKNCQMAFQDFANVCSHDLLSACPHSLHE